MLYESLQEIANASDRGAAPPRPAPVSGALPAGVVWLERAAATLRAALREAGFEAWRIFHCDDLDLDDFDDHLPALDRRAHWQPLPAATVGGDVVDLVKRDRTRLALQPAGWVRIARFDVAVARWYWVGQDSVEALWLVAAPDVANVRKMHRRVVRLRRTSGAGVWQFVGEPSWSSSAGDRRRPRAHVAPDELVLDDAVRARVETDVIRFFSPDVEALHRGLGVPYRRGVLLHGPP